MTFNNGTANYDPGSVSVKLGNIGGLENISYPNSFRFVDRLNNQSIGTFSITSGVPSAVTWDVNPQYFEGLNGATLIRGYRGAGNMLRSFVIINGQSVSGTGGRLIFDGAAPLTGTSTATTTDESQKVYSIQVTNGGSGFTSQPTVVFAGGGGGTGAAATAIINGQGFVTAVVVTAKGSGYSSTPTVSFSGGGGSGATATVTRGVAQTITSISAFAVGTVIPTFSSPPTVSIETSSGTNTYTNIPLIEPTGITNSSQCFVRDPVTLEVLTGVQCIPIWNGRLTTAGAQAFDDALLIIRPRIILTPTFNASGSGPSTVYSGTMDPVTDWVKAVLRYRRSCTVDLEIFGASRLLFLGKLTIVNDAT